MKHRLTRVRNIHRLERLTPQQRRLRKDADEKEREALVLSAGIAVRLSQCHIEEILQYRPLFKQLERAAKNAVEAHRYFKGSFKRAAARRKIDAEFLTTKGNKARGTTNQPQRKV